MKRFLVFAGFAASLSVGSVAHAQLGGVFDTSTFSARAGIYLPADQGLRDFNTIWFAAGADLEIPKGLVSGASTVISVDWFTYNGGGRNNVFPVILSQRFYTNHSGQAAYFQVGIGAAFADFGQSDTVFAARGGVGIQMNERFFLEANAYWTERPALSAAATGVAVFGGVRF
jgi:hypothetical protein